MRCASPPATPARSREQAAAHPCPAPPLAGAPKGTRSSSLSSASSSLSSSQATGSRTRGEEHAQLRPHVAPPRLGEPARPLAVGATISTAAALGCAPRAASGRWRRSSRGGIPCQLWEGGERRRPLETRHGRAAIGTTTGSGQRPATPSTATARARVLPAEPRGRRRPLPPLALPAARRRDLHPRASMERVCGGADGRSRPRELALAQDPAHPHRRRPRSVSSLHARVRQALPERLRQPGHHCHHWSCHQLSQGWAQRTSP